MSQNVPLVTLANLQTLPDITKSTIQLFLQISIGSGYYTVGGVPMGLKAFANSVGISANAQYLIGFIQSEIATQNSGLSLPTQGGFQYKYIPASDLLQIFENNVELTASEPVPPGVLNDIVIGQFIWNRL